MWNQRFYALACVESGTRFALVNADLTPRNFILESVFQQGQLEKDAARLLCHHRATLITVPGALLRRNRR